MDLGLFILRLTEILRNGRSRRWLHALIGAAVVIAVVVGIEAAGWWPDGLVAERGPRIPMLR